MRYLNARVYFLKSIYVGHILEFHSCDRAVISNVNTIY